MNTYFLDFRLFLQGDSTLLYLEISKTIAYAGYCPSMNWMGGTTRRAKLTRESDHFKQK